MGKIPDIYAFKLPPCTKTQHLVRGHRLWCRGCRKETERQFKDLWNAQIVLHTRQLVIDRPDIQVRVRRDPEDFYHYRIDEDGTIHIGRKG